MSYLLVMAGGAPGAAGRHGVNRIVGHWLGAPHPWATLLVNVAGALLMGMLGGFTTFSAFSLDMMNLLDRGDIGMAFAYAAASVLASLAAIYAGVAITRVPA